MGDSHTYMLCALMVVLGLTFAHGYDLRTNRKFNILERKIETITLELQDVKADLRVEQDKSLNLEISLNELMDGKKMTAYDDKDSDRTEHHSVVDHQQEVGSVALSVEQRIFKAMKDEKNVRKQFEKQMISDLGTANKHTKLKFTALKETLSAVIDRKLDTIEDKVLSSVKVLTEASSTMANLTRKVQHNDDSITSLMLESDKLNTALLSYGTKLETIEVDLANNVDDLIDNSHRYKVCLHGGYHSHEGLCECTPPYYGNNCEKGCFNGGKYLDDGSCECSPLYYGATCEKEKWLPWSPWTLCSPTCGQTNGTQSRSRVCKNTGCVGDSRETIQCSTTSCPAPVHDCQDIMDAGLSRGDGVYNISVLDNGQTLQTQVFCNMKTFGGGWTVFQYRYNGSVNFNRTFSEFDAGFGLYPGEFWLGLKWQHLITKQRPYKLRVDLTAASGQTGFAVYTNFSVGPPPNYTLNIDEYVNTSTIVDMLRPLHNHCGFTTYDRDVDKYSTNCADDMGGGGWWYCNCGGAFPNGPYLVPGTGTHESMCWSNFPSGYQSLLTSKLSFKPM